MRNIPFKFLIPIALVGCSDEEPSTSTIESALVQVSVASASPSPPLFERMQARDADDRATAQLNFELRIQNTGTQTAVLDRADLSYSGAAALAPSVSRANLRNYYLSQCDRPGFGLDRSGSLSLNLTAFDPEEIRDVDTPSTNAYLAVTGWRKQNFFLNNIPLDVSKFVVAKLDGGKELEWQVEVPFLNFEDRANALTLAAGDASYVVVGSTRSVGIPDDPYNQPFRFAAVQLDTSGNVVLRPDNTPWKRVIQFPGCTAEAVDVARLYMATQEQYVYFIAGNAQCAGDTRVAVAMLDEDGNPMAGFGGGSFVIDPGAAPVRVGAVTVDPVTNHLYVVGSLGDDVMAMKLDTTGALVAGYGAGGIKTINPVAHDQMMGWDAKVMSDRRLAIATTGRRTPANVYQLGMVRLQFTGANDPLLPGGYMAASVPGMTHASGHAIEIHENETWFTVSGIGENLGKRRMIVAAFAVNGAMRTQFDGDGFLLAGPAGGPHAFGSSIDGDYITIGGASGGVLGGARFHRKDGSPDDPSVLGIGESCALLWPDTGVLPSGATHVINEWDWSSLPTNASAQLRFVPYATGTGSATTTLWAGAIEAPRGGFPFPGRAPTARDTFWKINWGHEVMDDHRRALGFSVPENTFINKQRYAYDIGMVRWNDTTDNWTSFLDGTDGDQNNEYVVHGKLIYPMANGYITHCASGVAENIAPGVKNVAQACNENGIPCLYAIGGNYFRIQHLDGSTSYYAHLQNDLDPDLCPLTNAAGSVPTPIWVTTNTALGKVGNSGNSTGPHLHLEYSKVWDATDPAKSVYDYGDGRPLLFNNVHGVKTSVDLDDLPPLPMVMPVAAQWGSTLLRFPATANPPDGGPTTCQTVNINSVFQEARQADGDAGPTLYCPGDNSVCIRNGDGTSDCQTCNVANSEVYPGCPCDQDDQCGSMTCWGDHITENVSTGDMRGLCYPMDDLPAWSCGYDCRANFGPHAWCYNDFASLTLRARCMDDITSAGTLEMCWADDQPALGDECVSECLFDAECQTNWHYPSEYQCDNDTGVPICRIPL